MPNPGKILGQERGYAGNSGAEIPQKTPLTKRTMLSQLGKIYDPLGIISATTVEGKCLYRDACDGNRS